ncbi:hypothetical protein ADL03_15420 [Nocardia sp. NRRL S-836]|nr:hypothetical protein ADL03_15420 [Nocardia sp. NRRL S-836]
MLISTAVLRFLSLEWLRTMARMLALLLKVVLSRFLSQGGNLGRIGDDYASVGTSYQTIGSY